MPRKKKHNRTAGEGTVIKRKDGRWCAQTPPLPELGGLRKSFYGHTSEQAVEKRTAFLALLTTNIAVNSGPWSVSEWAAYWLENIVRPNRRFITHTLYETAMRRHILPYLGKVPLRDLTPQHVQIWLNRVRVEHKLSASTVRTAHSVLRAALSQAARADLVLRNVATLIELPKNDTARARFLTEEEARALLQAVSGDRLEAFFVLALALGLRRGELLALTWQDIDLDKGILYVRHTRYRTGRHTIVEEPKTKASKRTRRLPAVAVYSLKAHRARQVAERLRSEDWHGEDYVFTSVAGYPASEAIFNYYLRQVVKKAGLPSIHIHGLRHTAVSLMIAQKLDIKLISEAIGHTTISTTLDIYGHLYEHQHQEMADAMDRVLDPKEDVS